MWDEMRCVGSLKRRSKQLLARQPPRAEDEAREDDGRVEEGNHCGRSGDVARGCCKEKMQNGCSLN